MRCDQQVIAAYRGAGSLQEGANPSVDDVDPRLEGSTSMAHDRASQLHVVDREVLDDREAIVGVSRPRRRGRGSLGL
jgi:hypothetical protein